MEEVVPTAETWTLEGPRISQREPSSVSCRVRMTTTRQTVPTLKEAIVGVGGTPERYARAEVYLSH